MKEMARIHAVGLGAAQQEQNGAPVRRHHPQQQQHHHHQRQRQQHHHHHHQQEQNGTPVREHHPQQQHHHHQQQEQNGTPVRGHHPQQQQQQQHHHHHQRQRQHHPQQHHHHHHQHQVQNGAPVRRQHPQQHHQHHHQPKDIIQQAVQLNVGRAAAQAPHPRTNPERQNHVRPPEPNLRGPAPQDLHRRTNPESSTLEMGIQFKGARHNNVAPPGQGRVMHVVHHVAPSAREVLRGRDQATERGVFGPLGARIDNRLNLDNLPFDPIRKLWKLLDGLV